jgi:hypothetical protein
MTNANVRENLVAIYNKTLVKLLKLRPFPLNLASTNNKSMLPQLKTITILICTPKKLEIKLN